MMNGFWVAPQDFLDDAGLQSFVLYVADTGSYIIIVRDDGILVNEMVDVHVKGAWSNWMTTGLARRTYSVHFDGVDNDFFPSRQTMTLERGKIVLFDKDTVFAVLYHNAELTDAGNCAESCDEDTDGF